MTLNRKRLHAYQTKAIDFICTKHRCALWMFMGAGKSVSALTAVSDLISACAIRRVLIIAPLRVTKSVWKQEAAKWSHLSHLRISLVVGSAAEREDSLKGKYDIYCINKENVTWLVDLFQLKRKWPFDGIIIDESSCIKNPSTKIFRSLKKVAKHTDLIVELTGTPAPNSLMDVWSQIYLLDHGEALGRNITSYRTRYFDQDYWGHQWTIKKNMDSVIHNRISDMVLSMTGDSYIELPERINLIEKISLPSDIQKLYDNFEKDLFIEYDNVELEAVSAAVLANKLLQMASGAIYTDTDGQYKDIHSAKLNALTELLDENAGENILLAYNYKHTLKRLQKRFPTMIVLDKNPKTIDLWNMGKIPLLAVHPQSAGHGLNLQKGGSLLIWVDLTWSLEAYQQLCARLHRQGQDKPVRIVHIICENTIDERVINVLERKDCVQNDLLTALRNK